MQLTFLNGMAGSDFPQALDRYQSLGLRRVDLKDHIWGRALEDLTESQAAAADGLIRERGLSVHCLSTALGWCDVSIGEAQWRRHQEQLLGHILSLAAILRPRYVRILAVRARPFAEGGDRLARTVASHPWLIPAYGALIDRIGQAGFCACVENEADDCSLAAPADVSEFFHLVGQVSRTPCAYIWDVQNMWQSGTFPTVGIYRQLQPWVQMIHLKGGRAGADGRLAEACGLRDASWPVREILLAAQSAQPPEAVCLNPSHGRKSPDYDLWATTRDDIAYLREQFSDCR